MDREKTEQIPPPPKAGRKLSVYFFPLSSSRELVKGSVSFEGFDKGSFSEMGLRESERDLGEGGEWRGLERRSAPNVTSQTG